MAKIIGSIIYTRIGKSPPPQFTGVIHTVSPLQSHPSPVVKLIIAVAKSKFCAQIVVLWNSDKPLPPRNKWPSTSVPLTVIQGQSKVTLFFDGTAPPNLFFSPGEKFTRQNPTIDST
ncbi:exostosin-1-like [Hippocampus comes]|uniref:exostosin-1-like n=1 Tax=Hippocampus comes TaxID=109280 RepID=UPI00094E5D1F|nr:PREDICTED: exostosin-1-like [Hippocampus comes]